MQFARHEVGNIRMIIHAHSVYGKPVSEWEPLKDHAEAVAKRAAFFAQNFGGSDAARILGWAHDLGKMKAQFQAKLRGEKNQEPHSGEGAKLLLTHCGGFGPFLAACVAGHHSGLPDMEDMNRRLAAVPDQEIPAWMPSPKLLGSRLIDRQSQNRTVAARAMAERKTFGHLS